MTYDSLSRPYFGRPFELPGAFQIAANGLAAPAAIVPAAAALLGMSYRAFAQTEPIVSDISEMR